MTALDEIMTWDKTWTKLKGDQVVNHYDWKMVDGKPQLDMMFPELIVDALGKKMLADSLNPQDSDVYQPKFEGYWSITECIGCPAALLHRALGCPVNSELTAETKALFHEGLMHEAVMKQQLKDKGHEVISFNQPIFHPSLPVVGHPDALVDGELVEFKTIADDEEQSQVLAHHHNYEPQVHGYMPLLNKKIATIVTKVRRSGIILPDISVAYDDEVAKRIWDNVEKAYNLLQSRKDMMKCPLVEPFLHCSSDYVTRMFCPYNRTHCTSEPKMVEGRLSEQLAKYAAVKLYLDDLTNDRDSLRDEIEKILRDEYGTRGSFRTSDGIGASYFPTGRKVINVKRLEELFPEVAAKVYDQINYSQLRITLPKAMRSKFAIGKKDVDDDEK